MNPGQKIVKVVQEERRKADAKDASKSSVFDMFDMAEGVGLAALMFGAPILIPAALLIGTLGLVDKLKADDPEAKKRHMPDDWLGQVSDWPDASPEGLAYLSKLLAKRGHITVFQAGEWLKIEHKVAIKKAEVKEKERNVNASGASALLNRAKRDIPTLVDLNEISGALKGFAQGTEQAFGKIPGASVVSGALGSVFGRNKQEGGER